MKALVTIFALMVAARCSAQTTTNLDFRFPIRVVNGQRVDLHYLFAHWRSGPDAVTNSRWVLLTGTIADDTPSGWVVDGKTESASGLSFRQKVLVLHPPRAEKQTLDALLARQDQLDKRNAALESGNTPQKPRHHHNATQQNSQDASNPQTENTVSNRENAVQNQLGDVDKQVAAIPTTDSTNGATYRVDFFVFYTGQAQGGIPMLDFGTPTH